MSNPDWFYEQGSPDPYTDDAPLACDECGYTNCQCDAAHDERDDRDRN